MRRLPVVALVLASISMIPLLAQENAAAKTLVARGKAAMPKPAVVNAAALEPLTERERAVQMLDRFTFGPRPGDVDRVLTMGEDKWFEQQLNPDAIKDPALDRRLADFPTLTMTPQQALVLFPDRGTIQRVADGKQPMPTDPLLAAMYEVQVAPPPQEGTERKTDPSGNLPPEPSDAEKAADK